MTKDFQSTGFTGESHFVSHAGSQIHYVTAGHGNQTLVFVHGWASHLGFWREQIPALAEKARLIFIDLPGHGKSSGPPANYTMEFFADAVLAVMNDAKTKQAVLVGHSMGGAVIAQIYHRAPERVAALVSVDGLLCRPPGRPEQATALVVPFSGPHYREHAQGFINTFFPVPGTEALRDRVMSEMLTTPQHVMFGGMLAMFSPEHPDWILEKVNAPVIVINAPSPWWNADYENYVRSLSPQSDYFTMDGSGHFLMLEQPAKFNALLLAQLQKFHLLEK